MFLSRGGDCVQGSRAILPDRPPNGSRLSCGRNAHGRKAAEWQVVLGGEETQFFLTRERRQLQAHVRLRSHMLLNGE